MLPEGPAESEGGDGTEGVALEVPLWEGGGVDLGRVRAGAPAEDGSDPINMVPWADFFAGSAGGAWGEAEGGCTAARSMVPLNLVPAGVGRGFISASQLVQRRASSWFLDPQFEQYTATRPPFSWFAAAYRA